MLVILSTVYESPVLFHDRLPLKCVQVLLVVSVLLGQLLLHQSKFGHQFLLLDLELLQGSQLAGWVRVTLVNTRDRPGINTGEKR